MQEALKTSEPKRMRTNGEHLIKTKYSWRGELNKFLGKKVMVMKPVFDGTKLIPVKVSEGTLKSIRPEGSHIIIMTDMGKQLFALGDYFLDRDRDKCWDKKRDAKEKLILNNS